MCKQIGKRERIEEYNMMYADRIAVSYLDKLFNCSYIYCFLNELTVVSVNADTQASTASWKLTIALGISAQKTASVWTSSTTTATSASQDAQECCLRSRQMNARVPHVLMVPTAWILLPVIGVYVLLDSKVSFQDRRVPYLSNAKTRNKICFII